MTVLRRARRESAGDDRGLLHRVDRPGEHRADRGDGAEPDPGLRVDGGRAAFSGGVLGVSAFCG